MVFFTSFLLFTTNTQNVHAMIPVTNPISDTIRLTIASIEDVTGKVDEIFDQA